MNSKFVLRYRSTPPVSFLPFIYFQKQSFVMLIAFWCNCAIEIHAEVRRHSTVWVQGSNPSLSGLADSTFIC